MYSHSIPKAVCTLFMCMVITTDATRLQNGVPKEKPEADVCLTPQCIYAATRILTRMNSKVRPCDDFYEFVCGDYAQSALIPDGSPMINQSYEKELETMSRLQRLIEDIDESKAPAAFSELKKTYNKCIASELSTRDESADDEWHGNVIRIKNLWSMLARDNWISPEFDESVVGGLIFRFDPKPSVRNRSIEVLELAIDDTAIPWSFLRSSSHDVIQIYSRYLRNVAFHLSGDESGETRIAEDLPQILSFEIQLAKILFPEQDIHKSSFEYHVTTVGALDKKYPNWQLKQRIVEVHDADEVQIPFNLKILDDVQRVFADKQGSRNFDAWVIWRLTDLESDRLGRFVTEEKKKLRDAISGTGVTTSLREKCVERVRSKFPFLLNVLYYGQYLNYGAVKRSKEILDRVRQQYLKYIKEAEWLDAKTRRNAAEKIKAMTNDIGIFEEFMLDKNFNALPGPKLSDGFLADNRAHLTKILLHTNPSREEQNNFIKSHARYNYESQLINIGGVSYSDAYYDVDRPEALNYGAFGYVVGSEVAYSFDEKGRHFDKNGKFESWWNSKNDAIFGKRSKCLVKQYYHYAFNKFGFLLDYEKPRNEDIANNVGAKAAYFAYDQWAYDKAPEKRLPGLNYSARQLFWMSLAATQCTRYRPEFLKSGALADDHTLAKIRVNAALSNLPEFSDDFQCHVGTKMNPVQKCSLW